MNTYKRHRFAPDIISCAPRGAVLLAAASAAQEAETHRTWYRVLILDGTWYLLITIGTSGQVRLQSGVVRLPETQILRPREVNLAERNGRTFSVQIVPIVSYEIQKMLFPRC